MKTKLFKTACVVLSLLMVCVALVACKRTVDAYALYEGAIEKNKNLSSVDISMKFEAVMKQNGIETKIPVNINFKANNLKKLSEAKSADDLEGVAFELSMNVAAYDNMSVDVVYEGGIMYMSMDGQKIKMSLKDLEAIAGEQAPAATEMPEFDMSKLNDVFNFSKDDLTINESKTTTDDTIIDVIVPSSKIKEAMTSLFEVISEYVAEASSSITGGLDDYLYGNDGVDADADEFAADENAPMTGDNSFEAITGMFDSVDFSDVLISMTINKDGYFSKFDFNTNISVAEADANVGLTIGLVFNNPGKDVIVNAPADAAEYIDYMDMMGSLMGNEAA